MLRFAPGVESADEEGAMIPTLAEGFVLPDEAAEGRDRDVCRVS